MRGRAIFFTTTILATASVAMFAMNGHADRRDAGTRGAIGPDVVAWCIGGQNGFDFDYYGSSDGVGGYSMATVSCNWGDEVANWSVVPINLLSLCKTCFALKMVDLNK